MNSRVLLILGLLACTAADVRAQTAGRRIAVGRCVSEPGSLLWRADIRQPWQHAPNGGLLVAGDLIVALGEAALDGTNGDVRLLLKGNAGSSAPLPILESAIVPFYSRDVDLDFALLRGRVDVLNRKAQGEVKVRVRGPDGAAEIRLLEPGAHIALVLSGRWPPGAPFRKDTNPDGHRPASAFVLVVLRGEVEVSTGMHQFLMREPPGPALLEGSQVADPNAFPSKLDKLPDWAVAPADSDKKVGAGLARLGDLVRRASVSSAINQLLQSNDAAERNVAVALQGATDDLDGLSESLARPRTSDILEDAIKASRNWIGREPGQDAKLYRTLIDNQKLSAVQAETVLQLLHGFDDDSQGQPETFEALIDLLESDQPAIRGLAQWHLYRLAPAGRKIDYDALASTEKRAAAVEQWRKLIPVGKLPPSK